MTYRKNICDTLNNAPIGNRHKEYNIKLFMYIDRTKGFRGVQVRQVLQDIRRMED